MMTFDTDTPLTCGIVETDSDGVVVAFHEKVVNPPGRCANAAVYLLEPVVLDWLADHPDCTDFSTQVLPQFMGRIATWHNSGVHRDIGTLEKLWQSQSDPKPPPYWAEMDDWQSFFAAHPVHEKLRALAVHF